ncbi:MAG: hypothetical protein HYZ53_28760 [Planctomycetes bacterium]|nr:hypothetical protein [Planctomycetota bacterium]
MLFRKAPLDAGRAFPWLVALLLALSAPDGSRSACADLVRLKNGAVLEGQVTETATEVRVQLPFGEMVVPRGDVASIERADSPAELYRRRASSLVLTDTEAHLELARWCLAKGLREEARRELQRVLAIDPAHGAARLELDRLEGRALPQAGPGWIELSSPPFLLRSPGRPEFLERLQGPVQALVRAFVAELDTALRPKPLAGPYPVQVFTRAEDFQTYVARTYPKIAFVSESSRACLRGYADLGKNEVLALEDSDERDRGVPETLLHEITHLLVREQLQLPVVVEAPTQAELALHVTALEERMKRKAGTIWIDEGLANFFGGSTYRNGALLVGRLQRGGEMARCLAELQEMLRAGKAPRPNALVAADAEDFGGPEHAAYYGAAWGFVHFLLLGSEGRYRGAFLTAVDQYRRGRGGLAAFRRAFGCDPNDLEGGWRAHVLALRAGP